MQLGSPNLAPKCSTMNPGKPFILGVKRSKLNVASHKNISGVGLCTLVSVGFILLRVEAWHAVNNKVRIETC